MTYGNVCEQLMDILAIADQLFSASEENIAIFDVDGSFVYGNPVLVRTLSAQAASAAEYSPQAEDLRLKVCVRGVVEKNQPDTFLYSAPERMGATSRVLYDLIHLHPICNSLGRVIAVIGFGRDLDYEATMQQTLMRRQHTFMRALLDAFPFIVWMKDTQGRFLEINQPMLDALGQTEFAEVYGKTDHDFFPIKMADGFRQADLTVLESGEPLTLEEVIQNLDGSRYVALTYKAPVKIHNEVIGTVGFARDISVIRALEQRVAKTNAEYQSLIEHLPVMILKYDRDCKRLYANSMAYQSAAAVQSGIELGVTPAESWSPGIINMTGEAFTEKLRQVMNTGEHATFDIHTNYFGNLNVCSVKIVPEYDEQQQVSGAITLIQNISESVEYRKKIEFLAYYDSLTELPNRVQFREKLEQALQQCEAGVDQISVMIIDLDHFKNINDALGHSMGDSVLVAVAQRLRAVIAFNPKIQAARLGGDEFSLFYPATADDKVSASQLAESIIQSLALPIEFDGKTLFVGASIGISCYPDHAETVGDLLKYADTAMYLAKHEGRNNYQLFKPEINSPVSYAHEVRSQLSHAITNHELSLHYQPIFDLETGKLVKYEALLRWHNPKLGQVDTEKFITIAEEFGLITALGDWVFTQACQDAVKYNLTASSVVRFCINLSPRQFLRGHLEKTVHKVLAETGCPSHFLEFEITERLLLEQSTEVLNTLQQWCNMGIHIAIDDFGTGYSSLSYLNKFPIHIIKLDKSFVRDICHDEKDATLIKAIIQMGLGLHKQITAEGIETEAQRKLLETWGCQLGQGYLLGKPQPFPLQTAPDRGCHHSAG
jgi:diguanylate cyclase (GGDEF)-like protein/PAS domain S-box-containing protein